MNGDGIEDKRLDAVLRHIENVRDDCLLLGERLIQQGKDDGKLGRMLIANGLIHDNSKLRGIEWQYLHPDVKINNPDAFHVAWQSHVSNNPHHPEYWPCGINEMSPVYLAEMVCDWHSRSSEFGTDLWEWIKDEAIPKYKVSTSGKTYKYLKEFVDLLLERKFK